MITGQIKQILTQKENDWGRYMLDSYGKNILVVGVIPEVTVGMTVVIEGREETNQYGTQFKITQVLSSESDECVGVRKFLSDGYVKGIGPTKAEAIVEMFGKKSADLFDTEEGRTMLLRVKGISDATIEKAMPSYEENKKYKDIVLFLNGIGTKNQVEQIYKKYGSGAVATLKKNPYRLQMDLTGFGFAKADKIALASGIKPDSIYRIMAAAKFLIDEAQMNGGHCFLTIEEIKKGIIPLLAAMPKFEDITERVAENAAAKWPHSRETLIKAHDPSADTLEKLAQTMQTRELILSTLSEALSNAINDGDFVESNGKIYTKAMYETEKQTVEMIVKMCREKPVRFVSQTCIEMSIKEVEERKTKELKEQGIDAQFIVTEEQRKAAYLGLTNRISIISGGPGRGKTAISEIIALGFLSSGEYFDKDDIIMLAPTGRAAQRITESTGYPAMTAQRAVMALKRGEDAPKGKLILCDEWSMADIYLAHSIMHYAKNSNIIFVGDVNQIASVGPGKVLKDMIDSGIVPTILLQQGHRNSGTIAKNSDLINTGYKINKYDYDEHFVYTPSNSDNIGNVIVEDYKKKVAEYGIKNVMLCTAMKERGPLAVNKLNNILQGVFTLGQTEASFGENKKFRVGDRVMQTKNDYNFVIKRNGTLSLGIFNGEKGTIAKISYDEELDDYKITVLFDDGSIGGYTKNTIANLTLAYATTLHKCQGSEAACMMMAYTFGDYMLLNRSLFYTGETRAKKEFRFYGEEKWQYGKMLSAFDIAVSRTDDVKRNTSLAEWLKEEFLATNR